MNDHVTAYIQEQEPWKQEVLRPLRAAIHDADPEIQEFIKWGTPSFEHAGAVVWLFCATEWVHVSFRYGSLLDVPAGTWEEDADTESQAKRTMKFRKGAELPVELIRRLVAQAVANNLAGRKVGFNSTKPGSQEFDLPHDHEAFLKEHGYLESYLERPYYQQKGWIQWIEQAKQEETRLRRREKMLQELEEGSYMPPKTKDQLGTS
jgi:hypothetical protein